MILCQGTTDKIQVITDAAATVDAHASGMNVDGSGNVTTYRKNTAISTATTTDLTAAPASGVTLNVKTLHLRNKDASNTVNVTVQHTDGTTVVQLYKVGLSPGDSLQYVEGLGFYKLPALSGFVPANGNTSDVSAAAADTYLTGSSISNFVPFIKAGMILRWKLGFSKTAAGTAAPAFTIRVGTAGTVSDTAASAYSAFGAGTAVIDQGWCDIEAIVRTIGASGIIQSTIRLDHNLQTTGITNVQVQVKQYTSGAINLTTAGLIIGLSCNPGAGTTFTFQNVSVTAHGQVGDS